MDLGGSNAGGVLDLAAGEKGFHPARPGPGRRTFLAHERATAPAPHRRLRPEGRRPASSSPSPGPHGAASWLPRS